MVKQKISTPDYSDYTLPKRKPGVPITRKNYTLDERVMFMLEDYFPGRSPALLRSSAAILYSLAGWSPSENPNPDPFVENQVVKYLVMYMAAGGEHEDN